MATKNVDKNAVKTRNWTDDETALLYEILADSINELKLFVIVFSLNCL